ncbi:MAG TPA: TonB-dependent receptor [Roseateles sp.]|uniref:TonB-dependent receptor n=1 Tax=Roseateles sp. TaxID=1971397 RepID=UPI002ED99E19
MSTLKPLLLTSAMLAALPVLAQTAKPEDAAAGADKASTAPAPESKEATSTVAELGRIVVTARRIGERLQDVPLSIMAMTGRDLEDRGVKSIADLSLLTPGLSYSPDFGRTGERPVVRGISVTRNDAPQPVSIFVDGVYVKDGALSLGLDDAQRVEVIKGPQSALYGRSTYAGAINYVTVRPGDRLAGKVNATVASDGELSLFGALTVPVKEDVFSMRVRVKHSEFGGQYTNSLDGSKLGKERSDSVGIQFFLRPSQDFDANLAIDSAQDRDGQFAITARPVPLQAGGVVTSLNGSSNVPNGGTCNGHVIQLVGNDPVTGLPSASVPASAATRANGYPCGSRSYEGTSFARATGPLSHYVDPKTGIDYGDVNGLKRDIDRGALTLNWYFGDGYTLTSQTAVTRQRANTGYDQSYNGTPLAFGSSWLTYDRDELDYRSQEVRLSSPNDQDLSWMVGAFYYDEDFKGQTSTVVNGALSVAAPLTDKLSTSIRNVAPFGRLQYQISPAARLSVEGRYSSERVKVSGVVSGQRTFSDFAPRVILDYKPASGMMVYGQLARGSKSGGFNTTIGLDPKDFSYDGEKITAVEIGSKSRLLDGRMLFNAALFQNNINGLQLSNVITYTNPTNGTQQINTVVNNVGKARTRGLELELMYQATPWLVLSGNYAYTDAKAISGTDVTNGQNFGGNMSVAGFTLPRTPKHSAAASAAVDFPIEGTGLRFTSRIDATYQSRRYADLQNLIWADAFTRINLSAGVRGGSWRLTGFVRNVADDNTPMNAFRYIDAATFRRTAADFLPRLRQYGVSLSYDF